MSHYEKAGPSGRKITNEWVISDTHFGHSKILRYCPDRGKRWDTAADMDASMVAYWNERVRKTDIVYHLGDFGLTRDPRAILPKLNGRLWLLRGNHDILLPQEWLAAGVEGILPSVWPWSRDIVFSHVPLHPMSLSGRWLLNVHGHIHERTVEKWEKRAWGRWRSVPDTRYLNASVEALGYRPLSARKLARAVQEVRT